jgi:hypothetical protein
MTLLDRILERGVQLPMDPVIAARIERHVRRIQPDPLFRRRLRGQVLNRYVAAREGLMPAPPLPVRRREVGVLGRGVLYASLLTAMSVTAVAAASQDSLPGDALFAMKLQLEEIRMRIAPSGLRDDLAAMALDERLEEVERLAEIGRWQLVDEAATRVAIAREELASVIGLDARTAAEERTDEALQLHADRLAELIATAPDSAVEGLERALQASTADAPPAAEPPDPDVPADTPAADPPASEAAGGSHQATTDGSQAAPPAKDPPQAPR